MIVKGSKTLNKRDKLVIEEFRKIIRDWRHTKNLTQNEAAEILGVEVATLCRYESPSGYPKISNAYNWLRNISDATGTTLTKLIDRIDNAANQTIEIPTKHEETLDSQLLQGISNFPFTLRIRFKKFCETRRKRPKEFEKNFDLFLCLFDLPKEKIDILRIIVTDWLIDSNRINSYSKKNHEPSQRKLSHE